MRGKHIVVTEYVQASFTKQLKCCLSPAIQVPESNPNAEDQPEVILQRLLMLVVIVIHLEQIIHIYHVEQQ
jgi:hypothetical protein